jgi:hypothetical protein
MGLERQTALRQDMCKRKTHVLANALQMTNVRKLRPQTGFKFWA